VTNRGKTDVLSKPLKRRIRMGYTYMTGILLNIFFIRERLKFTSLARQPPDYNPMLAIHGLNPRPALACDLFLVSDPRVLSICPEVSEKICESLTLVAYIYSRRASSMIVLVDIPLIIYTRLFIKK
jgi:hypothetical protein